MLVVEVERAGANSEFKEQVLTAFFGNNEIYYHDKAHYTRSELQGIIDGFENTHFSTEEERRETIQYYEDFLQTASDHYVVADEFESCNEYVGYRGEILYEAYVSDYVISIQTKEEYCPPALAGYEDVIPATQQEWVQTSDLDDTDITMEEAKEQAEDFLNAIGQNDKICISEEQAQWWGIEDGEVKKSVCYGYVLTYGTGVEEIAFSRFPKFSDFMVTYRDPKYVEESIYNGDRLTLTVTKDGIIAIDLQDPVLIQKISNPVEFLSLDTIWSILENEVQEHSERYDFSERKTFDQLQLMYFKTKDNEADNVYSYIPVWCLSRAVEGEAYFHPVFVNAIDGTVLYLPETEGE